MRNDPPKRKQAEILPARGAGVGQAIEQARRVLADGGLVAMPTETVYGLAADAANDTAVARVFEAKGRPTFNPLIAHVRNIDMARTLAEFTPDAEKLARACWPGPLTLVLPRRQDAPVSRLAGAGLDTLALRAPKHETAQALIAALGRPLVAPSANLSGAVSPTTAAHVATSLGGRVDLILDGGPCAVGLESTIVKLAGGEATLLRPGGLSREAIEALLRTRLQDADAGAVEAPGMLVSHYAPRARLRLNAATARADEAFLGFGKTDGAEAACAISLSAEGDLVEAASRLFAGLHALDEACAERNLACIAVAPIPATGLGEAINDRLARAAAPRSAQ